jgi:hypothetical protein
VDRKNHLMLPILLSWTLSAMSTKYGLTRQTALKASLLLWAISRLYGMGHVVMGQMPLWIFAIMATGLLVGFIAGGQILYAYLKKRGFNNSDKLDCAPTAHRLSHLTTRYSSENSCIFMGRGECHTHGGFS